MKNNFKFLALLLSVVLFSCNKDDDSSGSLSCNTGVPFIQSGKYLFYNLNQFGFESGQMKLEYGNCDGNGIYNLNRKYYDLNGSITLEQNDKIKFENGYMAINIEDNEEFYERLYKLNPSLNDSWSDTKADGTTYTRTVVDLDSLVSTPAGSFNCKVYLFSSSTGSESYIFWNDQIGEIFEDAGFFTLKLDNYN
jgi:hypothetical protein